MPQGIATPAWSNRKLALVLLAGMGVVGSVFLVAALLTQTVRREHDLKLPKPQSITVPIGVIIACDIYLITLIFALAKPEGKTGPRRLVMAGAGGLLIIGLTTALATITIRSRERPDEPSKPAGSLPAREGPVYPGQLPALGYLQGDTNIIAAVRVAEILKSPSGRDFLNHGLAFNMAQAEKWTGLKLEDLDHVAIGLRVDDRLIRLTVVVQTRHPYSLALIKEALKTSPLAGVRFPSERIVILGLSAADLKGVPTAPGSGIAHLSSSLQKVINEYLDVRAQAWIAGADTWEKTLAVVFLNSLPPETKEVVRKARGFGVWVGVNDEITLAGFVDCGDISASEAMAGYLRKTGTPLFPDLKVEHDQVGQVTFQAKTNVERLHQALTQNKVRVGK